MIYNNGSEFKLHFRELCDSYQLKHKPTTVKNPQSNAILEHMHGVLLDMMQTSDIDMSQTVNSNDIDAFLTNAAWAIHATHHTVLQLMPGTAIFGQDMLFDIPHIADWSAIGHH